MSDANSAPPGFLQKMVGSAARHIVAGAAGAMLAHGIFTSQTQVNELGDVVSALAVYGLSLWWAGLQHKAAASPQSSPADDPPS